MGDMDWGELTWLFALIDPAGEPSTHPSTWIGAFTVVHQRSEP